MAATRRSFLGWLAAAFAAPLAGGAERPVPFRAVRAVWYCNRTTPIEAIRGVNVLLRPSEYAGEPILAFRGVPVRITDSFLNGQPLSPPAS
jgi:hypothetical protein